MLKDQKMAQYMCELLEESVEAAKTLCVDIQNGDWSAAAPKEELLGKVIALVRDKAPGICAEVPQFHLVNNCRCIQASLLRVRKHDQYSYMKAKCEFYPSLSGLYVNFYFWCTVYPDRERIRTYRTKTVPEFVEKYYVSEDTKNQCNYHELVIAVLAYNKLEVTKRCIESLLRNLPPDLDYQLLLYNHGSTDGTREYFESCCPDIQMDIAVNGGACHSNLGNNNAYELDVSNDVLILKNSIGNMLQCIKSDDQIAWVVPQTPNVTNLQAGPELFQSQEELQQYAEKNNQYAIHRHIQRSRLCNPLTMWGQEAGCKWIKYYSASFFSANGLNSFGDDSMSLWFRRHKKKLILAKDAYCYHFGSITVKSELKDTNKEKFYMEGRRKFYDIFQVDPWGTGFCYDYNLHTALPRDKQGHLDILGVNNGLGDNVLQIKESYKELYQNFDCKILCIYDDQRFAQDLEGIADVAQYIRDFKQLSKTCAGQTFDYILAEDAPKSSLNVQEEFNLLTSLLKKDGYLCIWLDLKTYPKFYKENPDLQYIPTALGNGYWALYHNTKYN